MDYYIISLLCIVAIIYTIICSIRVKTTFNKYSKKDSSRHITGAQAAQMVLHQNGVHDVSIQRCSGKLTDHYDPRNNTISLSDDVYDSTSVAAIGVACHEAGHAVQHATAYAPLKIRNLIIPITNFGARFSSLFIMAGLILSYFFVGALFLAEIGIALFAFSTLFQLITLPTEFNASRRAISCITDNSILTQEEQRGAKKVLKAAAMTYVAALALSLLELLRLVAIVNRRR